MEGGRGTGGRGRKEEERNLKSPVQMEATPPKASPPSWGPSPSERIELPQAHIPWGGTLFHGATKKFVLPNPPALREEIELRLLLWR